MQLTRPDSYVTSTAIAPGAFRIERASDGRLVCEYGAESTPAQQRDIAISLALCDVLDLLHQQSATRFDALAARLIASQRAEGFDAPLCDIGGALELLEFEPDVGARESFYMPATGGAS